MKFDARQLTSITKEQLKKQARFAAAKTLTQAGFDSRSKLQRYLRLWLNIKKPFLPKSIVVERATPKFLTATVGFLARARLVELLEKGGTRRPRRSKAIAVPTENARTGAGNLPMSRRPKQLLSKKNTFTATINGVSGIWQRVARLKKLKLLYVFERTTSYDRSIKFYKSIERNAPRFIQRNLMNNLDQAIKSRKR